MPANIVHGPKVRDDLEAIAAYVAQGGKQLALEWLSYIEQRIDMLESFPLIGPAFNETYRKLQARSFWILYRVANEEDLQTVTLVRIIHHKRDIQEALGQ